jgi:hypothetical protein
MATAQGVPGEGAHGLSPRYRRTCPSRRRRRSALDLYVTILDSRVGNLTLTG